MDTRLVRLLEAIIIQARLDARHDAEAAEWLRLLSRGTVATINARQAKVLKQVTLREIVC